MIEPLPSSCWMPPFTLRPELSSHPSLPTEVWILAWCLLLPPPQNISSSAPVPVCRLREPGGRGVPTSSIQDASWSTLWIHLMVFPWVASSAWICLNVPLLFGHRAWIFLAFSSHIWFFPDSTTCVANIRISSMPCTRILWRAIRKGNDSGVGLGRHFH